MLSCEFCETVKNIIFTDHLGNPASVFLNIPVISQVLISQISFSNHLKHIEMYTCESKLRERENLFSFFTSDSVNLLLTLS